MVLDGDGREEQEQKEMQIFCTTLKSMTTASKNLIAYVTYLAFWIRLGHNSGAFLCLGVSCHIYKLEGLLMLLTSSSPHIHEC